MRTRKLNQLLLVLTLLLSQWMVFAHAFNHPALSAQDQGCEVCVHAQGADGGSVLDMGQAPLPLAVHHEAPVSVIRLAVACRAPRKPPIRGPPIRPV